MRRLAVLVLVTLLAALPAAAVSPTPQELLRYVPAAAEVVIGMDAAALRGHPLVQQWLLEHQATWSGKDTEAQEFLREAGLDPFRDVDSLVVAMTPRQGDDAGLAVFGGRFDPVSLAAALTKHGAEAVTVGSFSAYRLPDSQGRTSPRPLLYLTQDVVLAGHEAMLRAVLGVTPAATIVSAEVAAGRVDPRSTFWMVAAVPPQVREQAASAAAGAGSDAENQALRGVLAASRTVQRVVMQATLADELTLSGSATADSGENAELLRDAIKGALAVARLQAQDQAPELVEVLREVRVSSDGSEVRGQVAIPVAIIEKLAHDKHPPCEAPATI